MFRVPLVLTWLGRVDEAESPRARVLATSPSACSTRSSSGCRSPRSPRSRWHAASSTDAEQYAHRALLLQRLSGYHWAAGLFLPPLACAHVARGQYEQARDALTTWSETADELEQASVNLFTRWVDACERRLVGAGCAAPRAPRDPMVGADAWAALRGGARATRRRDRRPPGRPRPPRSRSRSAAACSSAAPRPRRRVTSASRRTCSATKPRAVDTLGAPSPSPASCGAAPEVARAQADLAVIRLRRGEQTRRVRAARRGGRDVPPAAASTPRPRGSRSSAAPAAVNRRCEPIAADQRRRSSSSPTSSTRPASPRSSAPPTTAPAPGRSSGRSPVRSSPTAAPWSPASAWATASSASSLPSAQARRRGPPLHRRRAAHRPAPPRRGAPGRAHRRRRPHLRWRGQHGGARVRVERARRDPGVGPRCATRRSTSPRCASSTAASTCSRASPRRSGSSTLVEPATCALPHRW